MLDLTQYTKRTFNVKLPDGQLLKLKKPTQRFALQLSALSKVDISDIEQVCGGVTETVLEILNHNENGKEFNAGYVDLYLSLEMCMAIISGYIEFMNDLTNEKN